MKHYHSLSKVKRHRFTEFVIYRDSDCVELASSNRHLMRARVRDAYVSPMFAVDVTQAQ
jgi:hypothetical protein